VCFLIKCVKNRIVHLNCTTLMSTQICCCCNPVVDARMYNLDLPLPVLALGCFFSVAEVTVIQIYLETAA